ncbi:MAG: glycosyltransferase family 1 protein [Planctomycetota bacterium]
MSDKRVRVLHVVGGMNRGGVETWLMHVLRNIDRGRFQLDFLVHTEEPCAYDEEIRALGSRIIPCLHPQRPWQYARQLRRILREEGPYDVVHSHVHHFTGWVLKVAHAAGVPKRIAHCHNDTSAADGRSGLVRQVYLRYMERLIRKHATAGLTCSRLAAPSLFGENWERDARWSVLHCGVDMRLFGEPVDRAEVRRELGLPADAFVVGHVGRFTPQKNHKFLVHVFSECVKIQPQARLLLIGSGPLRNDVERQVADLGLSQSVVFAGLRSDVPRALKGAIDCFLFPSLHEGLPVSLIEVQCAGVRSVISDSITREGVFERNCTSLPLTCNASEWARAVLSGGAPFAEPGASKTDFDLKTTLNRIEAAYA